LTPGFQLLYDPLYQVLLLSRFVKYSVAFLIETSKDLFEFIHCIMLDRVPQILEIAPRVIGSH
jgi:hypothetical protein